MRQIEFGSETEFVRICIPEDFSRDEVVQIDVEIAVNCFHGRVRPWIEIWDMEQFAKELRFLYDCLKGKAVFAPRDEQFVLKLEGTNGGHIEVSGEAWSQAQYENKLEFTLGLDQSYLLAPLCNLEELLANR